MIFDAAVAIDCDDTCDVVTDAAGGRILAVRRRLGSVGQAQEGVRYRPVSGRTPPPVETPAATRAALAIPAGARPCGGCGAGTAPPPPAIASPADPETLAPPDLAAGELDWICESCPQLVRPASGCGGKAYCQHFASACSRRAHIAAGRPCVAMYWLLLPSWAGQAGSGILAIIARNYAAPRERSVPPESDR